jgi:hypothetical protein
MRNLRWISIAKVDYQREYCILVYNKSTQLCNPTAVKIPTSAFSVETK